MLINKIFIIFKMSTRKTKTVKNKKVSHKISKKD